jgi:hypothetical protein
MDCKSSFLILDNTQPEKISLVRADSCRCCRSFYGGHWTFRLSRFTDSIKLEFLVWSQSKFLKTVSQSIKQLDAVIKELGSAQLTIDGFKLKDPVCNTKECVVSGKSIQPMKFFIIMKGIWLGFSRCFDGSHGSIRRSLSGFLPVHLRRLAS